MGKNVYLNQLVQFLKFNICLVFIELGVRTSLIIDVSIYFDTIAHAAH